jgi:cysteine desulfuration protein SufE
MHPNPDGRSLHIEGDSDALIVKGLVALVIAMFGDRPFDEIAATNAQAVFGEIGLRDHLTAQRSNGLAAMVTRIKAEAARRAA